MAEKLSHKEIFVNEFIQRKFSINKSMGFGTLSLCESRACGSKKPRLKSRNIFNNNF
jgi:hypothetical protein